MENDAFVTSQSSFGDSDFISPPAGSAARPGVDEYERLYARSLNDPEAFWGEAARELQWYEPWHQVLDRTAAPFFKWFAGGKTNVILNAIDRHAAGPRRDHPAIIWESESGGRRRLTYGELDRAVCRFANVLKSFGVAKGDRVAIYMPRIPEQAIAMFACAKIGAVHTVVYGGLSVEALHSRIVDAGARLLITADGGYLNNKIIELKTIADAAVCNAPTIEKTIVIRRTGSPVTWVASRDHWWHEIMESDVAGEECATEQLDAEDPFFIIYTSGSTGAPKGVVHTVGGYCVDLYASLKLVLDLREDDILFCTSDAGWLVGHSIMLYGALMHGITTVIYEGAPAVPNPDRWWEIVERYRVTVFYTAPTAIRGLMRFGDDWPSRHDLTSLRLLSVAGEPLNPSAWSWFYEVIGQKRCPVIDSWWQTETSRPMISSLPALPMKAGSCGRPMPGVGIMVVNEQGNPVPSNTEGLLLLTSPWPGMLRTIFRDPERYVSQYWSRFPGYYLTGDAARVDADGYVWVIGRVDDVIKVSGYRLGTAEVESALVSHAAVAEAAVIGLPHAVRGNVIHAFVILRQGHDPSDALAEALRQHVVRQMGPIARPEAVNIVSRLPKTRSGKIMRRVLRAQALGEPLGDLSTMEE
ncbi:MAG TPA: acetate--CoA ligase [Pyrinomonadaceae bacterium]|nr:acetate--CoA ligase [Pyrinomonadaceae bacterium]